MAVKQPNSNAKRVTIITLLLLIAAGAVVAFQADIMRLPFSVSKSEPTYEAELLEMVSVKGAVKVKDLHLSQKEARKINNACLKHRKVFPKVDVTLNMTDQFAPIDVQRNTKLQLTLVFTSDEEAEVRCWTRTVSRARLVAFMVRSMDKAVSEYIHYRDLPNRTREFRRLYI